MTRLVLKIFLAYWLAAGVVIVISDLEPHRHIHNPELMDALGSSLAVNGRIIAEAYENQRCDQQQKIGTGTKESVALALENGNFVCGSPQANDAEALVRTASKSGRRSTANHSTYQLIAVPVVSVTGHRFVVVLKSSYSSALMLSGFLPGYTTITISGVVTLFLAVLVALPIRRLRTAAQKIASGDLQARASWGRLSAKLYGAQGGDDIAQLVSDFNNMAERLQSLAAAQRLLLRDLSHELRSPLARLRLGLGLARLDAQESIKPHLTRIEMESRRLDQLIGQILSLSSMDESGTFRPKSDVDLSELVSDLAPDIQYEAEQSQVEILPSIEPECHIYGDAELIRSAVDNIMRNAIRYIPAGGHIKLDVIAIKREDTAFAIVRVSDNGPGIPEHELQAVLEPFYRAERSKHWQQDGFGIGLAIAKRAAAIHDGTISLRNREGGGLIVEITLPMNREI